MGSQNEELKKLTSTYILSAVLMKAAMSLVPPFRKVSDLFKRGNPFTRDYEIKKELGVPDSVFHRGYQLIHKN